MTGDSTITLMIVSFALFGMAFLLGAFLLGPTLYHRQLVRWAKRHARRELDPATIAERLKDLEL